MCCVQSLLGEREDQYRNHRVYKESHDELVGWLSRAREKIPSLKQRSLSDKLAIESAAVPLEQLLNKQVWKNSNHPYRFEKTMFVSMINQMNDLLYVL